MHARMYVYPPLFPTASDLIGCEQAVVLSLSLFVLRHVLPPPQLAPHLPTNWQALLVLLNYSAHTAALPPHVMVAWGCAVPGSLQKRWLWLPPPAAPCTWGSLQQCLLVLKPTGAGYWGGAAPVMG